MLLHRRTLEGRSRPASVERGDGLRAGTGRRRRRRPALLTALAVLLVAGCSTESEWTYDKPGVSPARFDQDFAQCQREADRPSHLGMSRAQRGDPEMLKRCMERKGYQVRRAE